MRDAGGKRKGREEALLCPTEGGKWRRDAATRGDSRDRKDALCEVTEPQLIDRTGKGEHERRGSNGRTRVIIIILLLFDGSCLMVCVSGR